MMNYLKPYPLKAYKGVALKKMMMLVIGFLSVCNAHAQTPVRSHKIEIAGFVFTPQTIEVKRGDSITWINRDIAPHTATGSDGSWDSGTINKGESKTIVVSSDMDLSYLCSFHPTMRAEIVVKSD